MPKSTGVATDACHPPHGVSIAWQKFSCDNDAKSLTFDWTPWLYTKPVVSAELAKLEAAYQAAPPEEHGDWWPTYFTRQGHPLKAAILHKMLVLSERTEPRKRGPIQAIIPVNDELGNICRTFGCDPAVVSQWATADPAFHLALFIQNALQIHLARTYGMGVANLPTVEPLVPLTPTEFVVREVEAERLGVVGKA